MMATKAEEMLEFLTHKDNIRDVIEILRRGEKVEERILMQFWTDLKRRIQDDPVFSTRADGPLRLKLEQDEDPWRASLSYLDPTLCESDRECLWYSIWFYEDKLQYGVGWQSCLRDVSTKLKRLVPVVELMKKLTELEYEESKPSWELAGYRSISVDNQFDFLSRIASGDAESELQEISMNFCELVKQTRDLVIAANQAIAAATAKATR